MNGEQRCSNISRLKNTLKCMLNRGTRSMSKSMANNPFVVWAWTEHLGEVV